MGKNVLAFERPADFYYRTAQKMMDNGDYITAVSLLRRALAKDPGNLEYSICYAELLTDMYKFEESNSVLFDLLARDGAVTPECFFNLGRNFLGLNDFSKAKDSFEKYIEDEPDGDYLDDMEDLFFLLEGSFDPEMALVSDLEEKKALKKALIGKKALDASDYDKAIQQLEEAQLDNAGFLFAKNNLALAYFCVGRIREAYEKTREVLAADPQNVHANCNMALFLRSENEDESRIATYIAAAMSCSSEVPDDIYKMAITLCEMKEYEKSLPYLQQMMDYNPYDEKLLFYIAMTCYNLGDYKEAISYLSDIVVLDPPGLIASYYIGIIKEISSGKRDFEELGYVYQVPPDEVKRRIKYLNDCLHLEKLVFEYKWRHDAALRDTLIWGLDSGDHYIKKAMVEILSGQQDDAAEKILRRYLLKQNQPDDIKNNIFVALKKMGAKEPYVAYIDYHIVEVRVGAYDLDQQLSRQWLSVFQSISDVMQTQYPQHVEKLRDCMERLERYAKNTDFDEVSGDMDAFSAALHYIAFRSTGIDVDISELATHYNTTADALQAVIDRLLKR